MLFAAVVMMSSDRRARQSELNLSQIPDSLNRLAENMLSCNEFSEVRSSDGLTRISDMMNDTSLSEYVLSIPDIFRNITNRLLENNSCLIGLKSVLSMMSMNRYFNAQKFILFTDKEVIRSTANAILSSNLKAPSKHAIFTVLSSIIKKNLKDNDFETYIPYIRSILLNKDGFKMRFEQRCAFLRKWYETMEGKFTLDIIQNERQALLTNGLEINELEIVLPSLFFAGRSAFVHPKEVFFERMLLSRDNPWWSISNVLDKIIQDLMIKSYSECGSDQAMDRCFFFDLFESGKYFLTEQNKGEIILQEMMCIVDSNLSKDTKFNVLNDFFQKMISVYQDGLFAVRGACLYAWLPSDKRGMVSIAFYEFLCDLIHTEKTSLSINKDQFFLLLKDVSKYDYNLIFQSESEDKFEPVIDEPYSIKWLSSGCLEYFKPEDAIHITDLLNTITAYYNRLSREGFSDRLGY